MSLDNALLIIRLLGFKFFLLRPSKQTNAWLRLQAKAILKNIFIRLVVIFQETARNHFWEAGMLMQSYMLETVQ